MLGGMDEVTPRLALQASEPESDSATVRQESSPEQRGGLELAQGHLVAGRYQILAELGRGGMGVVWATHDTQLDRRVALKQLQSRGDLDSELQPRLLREARAMARISHPNVVAVYDAGTLEDGSVFIAMELVDGRTLRRWRQEEAPLWHQVLE